MKPEITTKQAMDHLRTALLLDDDYMNTWKANIAMAFHDELSDYLHDKTIEEKIEISGVANRAADRFLKLLLRTS